MPDFEPRVSLIIPTRNRVRKLANCLEAASSIKTSEPWELIVVDNASTDGTGGLLEDLVRNWTIPIRIVQVPSPGASRARNAGIEAARGELLIFIDDDCYVRPDIIDEYRKVFEDPALGFAGGRMLLHDPTDYPLTINETAEEKRFPAGRAIPCGMIQSGNLAIRRRVLEAVGGFDTRLGPATPVFSAEDWELIARIGASGWAGGYFPGPTVTHDHGRKHQEAKRRIYEYNLGIGAVYSILIRDRRTRRIYTAHILRRVLGDMKHRQAKIVTELYGAFLFSKCYKRYRLAPIPFGSDMKGRLGSGKDLVGEKNG
jgi:glycosyltransferase involved in cell wall biosynthesis